MDTPTIFMMLAAGWFASALLMLYLMANDDWVDTDDIRNATVFGPISFVLLAYFFVEDRAFPPIRRLYRRVKKRIAETWVIA